MKSFVLRWSITTLAVLVAAEIVPGIQWDSWAGLLIATLLLGLLNAVVRPILILFALPLVILTLGLFIFVINALLLYWVGHLKDFHVLTFGAALWGSVIISVVSMLLNNLTGAKNEFRVKAGRAKKPPRPPPADDGGGPVIDV